jgi:hypothetical protein
MSALTIIKNNLQRDISDYSSKLVSFDKIFDEDVLDAKHQQLEIISTEIQELEMRIMTCMIDSNDNVLYIHTDKFTNISDKMHVFHQREEEIKREIDILLSKRDELYTTWKEDYIRNAEHFAEAQTKLRKIQDIENSLIKLAYNKVKANNNIILLVYVHSQVNSLLAMANIKKEKSPYNAFKLAWNNQLIDDKVYDMLKP